MTQLGELVAVGMITANGGDGECPFHEKKHTCDGVVNELDGDASALGSHLDAGTVAGSTVVRSVVPDKSYQEPRQEDDPDDLPYEQREVQLFAGEESCWYPVGFQAHHLIPAKESLARCETLLKYIEKKKGKGQGRQEEPRPRPRRGAPQGWPPRASRAPRPACRCARARSSRRSTSRARPFGPTSRTSRRCS